VDGTWVLITLLLLRDRLLVHCCNREITRCFTHPYFRAHHNQMNVSILSAMRTVADVVVAGAGAAGLATAHFLKQLLPNSRILLVSRHAPFALTSSASTECFRDYWSAPVMRAFMRRSAHLTESLSRLSAENEARIALTKKGYLYVHQGTDPANVTEECSLFQQAELQSMYPYLSHDCTHAVLAKNAGWLSAHGLGMALLSSLQGSTMVGWDVVGATGNEGTIQGVNLRNVSTKEALHVSCGAFVNATGPLLSATHQAVVGSLSLASNAPLPVRNDVHAKVILQDVLG
jgi:glycine/D-amino acid oxidase-like deaminating enzyme